MNYIEFRYIIGSNIHNARLMRGATLPALSRATGISIKKIDSYEMGRGNFRLEVLLALAAALRVDIGALLASETSFLSIKIR